MNFAKLVSNMPVTQAQSKGLDAFQRYSSFLKPKGPDAGLRQMRSASYDLRHNPSAMTGYSERGAYTPSGKSNVYSKDADVAHARQSKVSNDFNRFQQMRSMGSKSTGDLLAENNKAELDQMADVLPFSPAIQDATPINRMADMRNNGSKTDIVAPPSIDPGTVKNDPGHAFPSKRTAESSKGPLNMRESNMPNPLRDEVQPIRPTDFENADAYNAAISEARRSRLPSAPNFDKLKAV
jgi:hypothetical protein